MRVCELFEAIDIPITFIDQLRSAIGRWIHKATSGESNYAAHSKLLAQTLQPIVRNFVKPYFMSPEKLELGMLIPRGYTNADITGYVLKLKIVPYYNDSIKAQWIPMITRRRELKLFNTLSLSLTQDDYEQLFRSRQPQRYHQSLTNELASTISHEVTHLIQSLSNATHATRGKQYGKRLSNPGQDDLYLGDSNEIEAWAQGFATDILVNNDINNVDTILKMGITSVFGRPLIKSSRSFVRYRDLFNNMHDSLSSQKDTQIKKQIWQRFLKEVYEKLSPYLTPSGSFRQLPSNQSSK